MITGSMKMADVIHLDHSLLPIINRFGIQLGFGDKDVEEICREKNVNIDFFLEILNIFHDPNYFPKDHLQEFDMELILTYLEKTHEFYLEYEVPKIESLINELISSCEIRKENIYLLRNFFMNYKEELTTHIKREDETVYPYIRQLVKEVQIEKISESLKAQMNEYPIEAFAVEHDNVEEKLFDLKNIIIKYLPPPKNSNLCNFILFRLFELEKDLNDHARLEDVILIDKVKELEKGAKELLKLKK